MIVVSDTSVLTNLAAIGQFDLLHDLYSSVHVANGVREELNAEGKLWPGAREADEANWLLRHEIQNQILVTALRRDLGRGEAESIALALELKADLVLLDEREGRRAAQRLGLNTLGIVGILLEAKVKGIIGKIRPYLDALRRDAGFYLGDALYLAVLTEAGEKNG